MICRSQAEAARDRVRILRPTRESSLLYGDTRKILNFPHLEVVDLTLLDADFALSVLSEVHGPFSRLPGPQKIGFRLPVSSVTSGDIIRLFGARHATPDPAKTITGLRISREPGQQMHDTLALFNNYVRWNCDVHWTPASLSSSSL